MRFSARIAGDLKRNELDRAIEAKRSNATLDLTASNPTKVGLEYPSEWSALLADPRGQTYEPSAKGLPEARNAIAKYYFESLGSRVSSDEILVTASSSESYGYLFKLLANPGEKVLIPAPSYPLFEFLAGLESVRTDNYALGYDGAWHLDLDALSRRIDATTRAIVLVNPNNPTGTFLKRDELADLVELCQRHDLAIISDEVFADYAFEPDPRRVRSTTEIDRVLTFTLSGLSKVVGLPQMKLGWIVCTGPRDTKLAAIERLELIADTYLSVSTPIQIAVPELLAQRDRVQRQIVARTRTNRAFALSRIASEPRCALSSLHAEGGWYLVLRVPSVQSEEDWVLELLDQDDVWVHPGYFFDFAGEAFLVVSLLTEEAIFRAGFEKIVARVNGRSS